MCFCQLLAINCCHHCTLFPQSLSVVQFCFIILLSFNDSFLLQKWAAWWKNLHAVSCKMFHQLLINWCCLCHFFLNSSFCCSVFSTLLLSFGDSHHLVFNSSLPFCQALINKLGAPIISTSANVHGESTPSSFSDISVDIHQKVDYIVDYRREEKLNKAVSPIATFDKEGELTFIR